MSKIKDYYKTLQVPPISSEEEIKEAYKRLIKKHHPDLNPDNIEESEKCTRELTDAYNTLCSPDKRKEYDCRFAPIVPIFLNGVNGEDYLQNQNIKKSDVFDFFRRFFSPKERQKDSSNLSKGDLNRFSSAVAFIESKDPIYLKMACEEFKNIINNAPFNFEALYNLGLSLYLLGDFKESLVYLKRAQANQPKNQRVQNLIAALID